MPEAKLQPTLVYGSKIKTIIMELKLNLKLKLKLILKSNQTLFTRSTINAIHWKVNRKQSMLC